MAGDKDNKSQPVKINKWDGTACKNAIDDGVKEVLTTKLNYKENFGLIDKRLFICGLAVAIAMFGLLWDYQNPFPLSKPVLIVCVSSYFILMGILTLYTTYCEKGIFVVAEQKDNIWQASSFIAKFDDAYHLTLSVEDKRTGRKAESGFTKSFANFIDVNGVLVYEVLEPEVLKLHNSLLSDKKDK